MVTKNVPRILTVNAKKGREGRRGWGGGLRAREREGRGEEGRVNERRDLSSHLLSI